MDHASTTPPQQQVIILGAGPVGLAAALLLAAQGHPVSIHEAAVELDLTSTNSYPIGVNTRGQEALRRIDPELLEQLRAGSRVVEAFHIYNGRRRLARLESGRLLATTRASLTQLLLERVRATDGIELHLGHRVSGVDLTSRTIDLELSDGSRTELDASRARVIACDGVRSPTRTSLADQVPGFTPRVDDWGLHFRTAYSQPDASAPGLDPAVHHIFTSRGIYTATLADGAWGVVLSARDDRPDEAFLLSKEVTPEDVQKLRAHLDEHAPLASPLLTDDDLAAYFGRRPFGGAVVVCERLAFDEWLLLLGDAAHSVLPPTGEGVNSGLEDCFLLAEHAASGSERWFADFEAARLPDLQALGSYATVLRDNIATTDASRSAANVVLRIVDTIATALPGVPSARVESRLFGPESGLTPYREALGPWLRQRRVIFPVVRAVVEAVRSVPPTLATRGRRSAQEADER